MGLVTRAYNYWYKARIFFYSKNYVIISLSLWLTGFLWLFSSGKHTTLFYLLYYLPLLLFMVDLPFKAKFWKSPIFLIATFLLFYLASTVFFEDTTSFNNIRRYFNRSFMILVFLIFVGWAAKLDTLFFLKIVSFVFSISTFLFFFYLIFVDSNCFHNNKLICGSIFNNPNTLGSIFAVGAIMALWLMLTQSAYFKIILLFFVFITLTVGVLYTQSRANFFGLFLVSLFVSLFYNKKFFSLVAFSVVTLLTVFSIFIFEEGKDFVERGSSLRFDVWQSGISQAVEAPWLGHGILSSRQFHVDSVSEAFDSPHNIFIGVWYTGGIFALSALFAIYLLSLRTAWLLWRRTGIFLPLALLCFSLFYYQFEWTPLIHYPDHMWLVLWLPIGMAIGVERNYNLY